MIVSYEAKAAAHEMAKRSIEELGSINKAIDFHAKGCRIHFEIVAALRRLEIEKAEGR